MELRRQLIIEPAVGWKPGISEFIAPGYLSRGRAWGLVETGMDGRKCALTADGEAAQPGLRTEVG
jgi:hypothetical protein